MFMKCYYQLFPFYFKIQNIKKTKCMLNYYRNQELLFKDKVFQYQFINSETNYRQVHWMLCLKSK